MLKNIQLGRRGMFWNGIKQWIRTSGPKAYLPARFILWLAKHCTAADYAAHPDSGIGAEAPIRTAAQDRLRRADFAGRIARVLSDLNLQEGRVFAIRGDWGFGKSSLKNLVIERLHAQADCADSFDFNPWQWGDSDSIARVLFTQIANKLGGVYSEGAAARAKALRRYGAILTGASAPLKEAGESPLFVSTVLTNASVITIAAAIGFTLPKVAMVAAGLAIIALVIPVVGKTLTFFGRDRTVEPLDTVRRDLEKRLRGLHRPLVVFVDDIDRLEPKQIQMLLRQVKANANLPNIVFVLIFQPSIVERALDPVANGDGRAFLEKVVQTNFDLPAVSPSVVHRIFGEELSVLAGAYASEANGFVQPRWGNVFVGCIQPRLHNMRDARRLLSSIAVHLPLHAADNIFEVNIIDFLALETLRVFEPNLHKELFRQRDLLLQSGRFRGDRLDDVYRPKIKQLMEVVPKDRCDWAEVVLKELFPSLEWAFGGTYYSSDFLQMWFDAKRVCTPRYFPRYFELQTAEGELSESGFINVLNASSDKSQLTTLIADIEANGLLPSLAARFDESVDKLPVENAAILLPTLFEIGQKFANTTEANLFFSSPWTSTWRATSWFLKRIPKEGRGELTIEVLKNTGALSVAATLI